MRTPAFLAEPLESLEILAGSLPDRAVGLVREWAELHRAELEDEKPSYRGAVRKRRVIVIAPSSARGR